MKDEPQQVPSQDPSRTRSIETSEDPELPMISGKIVISTMVGVGIALAAFAWWARYSASQQVLATWGKEPVVAIRTGKKVELLRGIQWNEAGEPGFDEVTDISETPGLIHARHHLVHQKGFDWDAERDAGSTATWTTGLRFTRDEYVATMLFDFDSSRAFLVENQAEVTMRPIIVDALKKFLAELE